MLQKLLLFLGFLLWMININAQNLTAITYTESDANFKNPARGFYADKYGNITPAFVNSIKAQGMTLIHKIYNLHQFNATPISQDYLDQIQSDLNVAREGGVKVIPRFFYTDQQNGADAALDTVLLHINQLAPVLQANADVIAFMDAGFIGAWGEWYYSSHGLNNTTDRRTVLFALLQALPPQIDVVIRTPNYKRLIFNYTEPLDIDSAYSGSFRSRTGAHNDCFLADETDAGTYLWNDIEGDKDYLNADNRFLPQSGETCQPSQYSVCSNALIDLNRMHWTTVNSDYNENVLQEWIDGGCMPEIKKRLGYRFVLQHAEISDSIKPNGIFTLNFNVKNVGFANPFNPRGCEIILRNNSTKAKYRLVTAIDPRFWFSGDSTSVQITGGIPSDMPEGNYEAFLFLPDTAKSLHDRKDYAIRLANENVWEDSTGYNDLLASVTISTNASGEDYSGSNYFVSFSGGITPPPGGSDIIIDGNFSDWNGVQQLDVGANAENSGDALNANTDLLDMWAANSDEELFISYSLSGSFGGSYFYHVFFDTDNSGATGFHSGESFGGFDFMIENDILYSYAGNNGEWGWNYIGSVVSAYSSDDKRVEIAVPFSQIGVEPNQTIGLVFNVNDNDDSFPDDYAPNSYQSNSFEYTIMLTGVNDSFAKSSANRPRITAFPNPFNSTVHINLSKISNKIESIKIYNCLGELVKTFSPDNFNGKEIIWNGINNFNQSVNSGIYFLVAITPSKIYSLKLVYLK